MHDQFGLGAPPLAIRRLAARAPYIAGVLAAGVVIAAESQPRAGAIVVGAYLLAAATSPTAHRLRWLLPLAGVLSGVTFPLLGTALAVIGLASAGEPVELVALATAALAGGAVAVLGNRFVVSATLARVGLIGSPFEASRLREELEQSGSTGFEVAATITPDDWVLDVAAVGGPYLCALSQIGRAIDERALEMLVVTQEFPRSSVDEQLYREVVTRPVRVMDLHEFHEHRFGSVPLAEIDYGWFTELAGRHSHVHKAIAKRSLDLAVALPAMLVVAPVIAGCALLIRRDGGPALFRQERIGRGGEPFTLFKLRTMTHVPDRASDWTTSEDPRITKVGGALRRAHLDEALQLWNVVKGDMSLVGPRPEQVAYVEALSRQIPFYAQRHIVRPGVTGWAQVRLGYAGSVHGTAFKLCNDLYYIKHQTIWLDIVILVETLRTLVADRQFVAPPATGATMVGEGPRRVVERRSPDARSGGGSRRAGD